jgi:hypothetical protein
MSQVKNLIAIKSKSFKGELPSTTKKTTNTIGFNNTDKKQFMTVLTSPKAQMPSDSKL